MEICDKLVPDAWCDPATRMRPRAVCDVVTVTPVLVGTDMYIADIEATADADTTATITHGLGATPLVVIPCPLKQASAGLSLWAFTTINSTTVVATKSTATGSGVSGNQMRVIIMRPHTIGK